MAELPPSLTGVGTDFNWGFWCLGALISVSCFCLLPSSKAVKGKLREARLVPEMMRTIWDNENWMNIHNMMLQFLTCCCYSSCGSCQHSRWQTLKDPFASGKLLSFAGPVYVCVRGEVGQTSIFRGGKENKWFLKLQKLPACKNWSVILDNDKCLFT